MTARKYSNTASEAELAVLVGSADTSVALSNFTGFPVAPFVAAIDPDTVDEEIVLVTGVAGSTVTMTRAFDGSTAKSHSAGAVFRHVAAAIDFQEANDHVNASSGVHGVTGAVVGTTDVQTLSNKTLTSPTVSAPTVTGTMNAAAAAFSGTVTVAGTSSLAAVSATDGTFSGTLGVTGVATLGSATVTGALSGSTASFSGVVSGVTPTAAAHLVTKSYADALGTASATASTIVRRNASGGTAVVSVDISNTPTAAQHGTRKDYVDAAVANAPRGHLVSAAQSGTASAPSTSPVALTGINGTAFTVTGSVARRVMAVLHAETLTGASGTELGRVEMSINGIARRAQFQIDTAGAAGEVSATITWNESLVPGSYTVSATVLRVITGTSVSVANARLTVLDIGAG